jgi:hypothetical protein
MTFEVEVPENTLEDDVILIFVNQKRKLMEKIGDRLYKITLTKDELGVDPNGNFLRMYLRGESVDISEYIPPEQRDDPFGHRMLFSPGKVVRDKVQRWRWFPEGPIVKEDISDLQPSGWKPRIGNMEFRSMLAPFDGYIIGHEFFYPSNAKAMKRLESNWANLWPPWQWYSQDPPKLGNVLMLGLGNPPNYPDDKLIEQIRTYKNEGIKVLLVPQICCTEINKEGRSKEWWQEYYNQQERYFLYYAKLADQEGVDAISFLTGTDGKEAGIDVDATWREFVEQFNNQ